jgi:hypothetical protein
LVACIVKAHSSSIQANIPTLAFIQSGSLRSKVFELFLKQEAHAKAPLGTHCGNDSFFADALWMSGIGNHPNYHDDTNTSTTTSATSR